MKHESVKKALEAELGRIHECLRVNTTRNAAQISRKTRNVWENGASGKLGEGGG
jgi:hypothetical protein